MTHPWEIAGFLDERNGHLCMDGVDVVALAEEHATPLFVFSESRIRQNIDRLEKVAEVVNCPVKVCYAAKAMSTMGILRVVRDSGIDLEVNSGGELWKALKAGFTGDQIIFNGTSKEVWEIEDAIGADIYAIQVDSIYELSLIEETAKRLDKRASVSLRLVPEIESDTHSGLQTAMLTSKFGMMPDEAFSAFREYKDSPHLDLCGIHLHVGSQNPDPIVYTQAFELLYEGLKKIYAETGIRLKHLNLGGGFPTDYLRGSRDIEITDANRQMFGAHFEPAEALNAAWHAIRESVGADSSRHLIENLTILIEPGRSIIADAGICMTTVRNAKTRPAERSAIGDPQTATEDRWLLTDAGFNILLSMETYKWYYHLISAERAAEPHETPYKLAGPLCDGGDVYFDIECQRRLPDHRRLPENVKPGEILALLNCGAYSLAQGSQYNGRFLPPVLLVRRSGEVEAIRRRDTFDDLIASDVV